MREVFVEKLNDKFIIGYEQHGTSRFMELTKEELYEMYTKCSYLFSKEKFDEMMEAKSR